MEKNWQIFRRNTRNSGRIQDDQTVKLRVVDGKLLLDLGKHGVYAFHTRTWVSSRAKVLARALNCHPVVLVFPGWEAPIERTA